MDNKYIESLNKLFNESSTLSTDQIRGFFSESLEFIQGLQRDLNSEDEEVREKALESTLQMKEKLEGKLKGICEKSGLSPEHLETLIENGGGLPPEEMHMAQEANNTFQRFKMENEKQ